MAPRKESFWHPLMPVNCIFAGLAFAFGVLLLFVK